MAVIEQTPQYWLTCQDDGREEKFQLKVNLPGVMGVSELDVVVKPNLLTVRVPGRYKLELPLDPPIRKEPEMLRFVKKKAQLQAVLVVDPKVPRPSAPKSPTKQGSEAPPASASTSAISDPNGVAVADASFRSSVHRQDVTGAGSMGKTVHMANGSIPSAAPITGTPETASLRREQRRPPQPADAPSVCDGDAASSGKGNEAASGSAAVRHNAHPRQVHDSFYEDLQLPGMGSSKARGGTKAAGGTAQQQQQQQRAPSTVVNGDKATAIGNRASNGPVLVVNGCSSTAGAGKQSATSAAKPNAQLETNGGGQQKPEPKAATKPAAAPDLTAASSASTEGPERNGAGVQDGSNHKLHQQQKQGRTCSEQGRANQNATPCAATAPAAAAAGNGGAEELYTAGKMYANREAAGQWLERALSAARQGDLPRAELLLGRAVGLCPELREQLTAEYNTLCDPDYRVQSSLDGISAQRSQQGRPSEARQRPYCASGAAGPASSPAPNASASVRPTNKDGQDSNPKNQPPHISSEAPDQSPESAASPGGRPSQPYSFTKPAQAESLKPEATGTTGAGPAPKAASGATSQGQTGVGGRKTAGGSSGSKATSHGPNGASFPGSSSSSSSNQQQHPSGGGSGQGPPRSHAAGARSGPQQPQQAASGSGQGPGFKSEPRARPPPKHRGGSAGSDTRGPPGSSGGGAGNAGEEAGSAGGGGMDRQWDWWFTLSMTNVKRWLEPYAAPGWRETVVAGLLFLAFGLLMVPHVMISFLAAVLYFLYDVAGYPEEAKGLERYCRRYARWMIGCSAVTGVPLGAALYVASGGLSLLFRLLLSFLFSPPVWLAALQTGGLFWAISYKRQPLLSALAPLPLLWSLGDNVGWRIMATGLYGLTHLAARGRVRAAMFAGAAVLSCRSLVWYQALPALLLEFIVWLMLAAAAFGPDGGTERGSHSRHGSRCYGSGGGADGENSEHGSKGRGRSGHGHAAHDVPGGGRLVPEHVKGASEDVARVLAARDHFAVLGLTCEDDEAESLTDEAVRAAYKRLQLKVHPDKAGPNAAGAEQASKRVNEAYALLQTAEGRRKVMVAMRSSSGPSAAAAAAATASSSGGPSKGDVETLMRCFECGDYHPAKLFSRTCTNVRYCSDCKTYHDAANLDVWIWEDPGAMLFPQRKLLMCFEGEVWDVTEMGMCCNMFHDPRTGRRIPPNTHYVPYRLGAHDKAGAGGANGSASQHFKGRGDKGAKTSRKGKRR